MIAVKLIKLHSGWLVILAALVYEPFSYGADYDALPKPTALKANISGYTLWLSLDTNGRNDGVVTQVQVRHQHYYVQNSVLKKYYIHTWTIQWGKVLSVVCHTSS